MKASLETAETYALAGMGAVGGAFKYYRPAPSTLAWCALGAGVTAYDLLAPTGQTLSEGVDRGLERGPLAKALIIGGIGATALHLANALPAKYDVFAISLKFLKQL